MHNKTTTNQHLVEVTKNLLLTVEKWWNQAKEPTAKDLSPLYSADFHLISNGETKTTSLEGYVERIKEFRKIYTECRVAFSKFEVITDKKCVVLYTIHCKESNGEKHLVHVMAICIFDNDKIASWEQVMHDSEGTWDNFKR